MNSYIKKRMEVWYEKPDVFVEEVCEAIPDDWQKDIMYDIKNPETPYVSVRSGQGVGKTAVESWICVWFLLFHKNSRVIATAPTSRQLNDVLWPEIAKWTGSSPLLRELLIWRKTYLYVKGYERTWFATARTATKPENMQGFHEENMLFIVDEASGVAEPIMEAIRGTLSGKNNKLLLMSNPTQISGMFYDSHTKDIKDFVTHVVNAEQISRTNKHNIKTLERKYGRESNLYKIRVLGEFPTEEDDVFMPINLIHRSIETEISADTQKALGLNGYTQEEERIYQVDIGCDVARFGNDKTVIGYRINEITGIYKKTQGKPTTWTAANLAKLYSEIKEKCRYKYKIPVKIDVGGIGGGVVDQLMAIRSSDSFYDDMMIIPVNFGQPIKHRYYHDTTTYMMGVLRELISTTDDEGNPKKPDVILPDDVDLIGELSCRKYSFTTNGKQKVESKDEMKKRGFDSPDIADCMCLVCLPVNTRKQDKNNTRNKLITSA